MAENLAWEEKKPTFWFADSFPSSFLSPKDLYFQPFSSYRYFHTLTALSLFSKSLHNQVRLVAGSAFITNVKSSFLWKEEGNDDIKSPTSVLLQFREAAETEMFFIRLLYLLVFERIEAPVSFAVLCLCDLMLFSFKIHYFCSYSLVFQTLKRQLTYQYITSQRHLWFQSVFGSLPWCRHFAKVRNILVATFMFCSCL